MKFNFILLDYTLIIPSSLESSTSFDGLPQEIFGLPQEVNGKWPRDD